VVFLKKRQEKVVLQEDLNLLQKELQETKDVLVLHLAHQNLVAKQDQRDREEVNKI
jgi:hypothetical protein